MNSFVLVSHFRDDIPEKKEVMKLLKEHLQYIGKATKEGKVLIAGPHALDDGSFGNGGVILFKADSKEEVEEILADDPFVRENIVDYNIYEFKIVHMIPELEEWFKS